MEEYQNNQSQNSSCNELLIDPEPFSVFLGIAGFLGSIASIAGYIEFKKNQSRGLRESRFKLMNEAKDLIMILEVDTMQIETSLRKLEFVLEKGTNDTFISKFSKLKFEFGTCKPIFTLHGFNKFDEITIEINRLVGKSFENTSKLLQKIYNLEIHFNNEIYEKLIGLQNKLNAILRKDLSYEEGFHHEL